MSVVAAETSSPDGLPDEKQLMADARTMIEMLGRLHEDISILQRAIRVGDGTTLENHFIRTRAIRRGVIAAKQA